MDSFSALKQEKLFIFNVMFDAGGHTTTDLLNRSNNAEYTIYFSTSPNFETNSKVSAFRTDNHGTTNMTQSKSTQSSKSTLSTAVVSKLHLPVMFFGPASTSNNSTILIVKAGVIGLFYRYTCTTNVCKNTDEQKNDEKP